MKLIFASDSFKGSLTSEKTIGLLAKAAEEVFPGCTYAGVPVADGGEGTTDAVVRARGGQLLSVPVHGPLMEPEEAAFGLLDGGEAILEMAAASGLPLVPAELRNPLETTTLGTGELVKAALDAGCRRISIAIGGSATNDGGMGLARALGVRFLDENGEELPGRGKDLERVKTIDVSGLDPRVKDAAFTVMCDVTNPLCGEHGATRTFGPQKGAGPEAVERLEAGMVNYRDVIRAQFGIDPDAIPGSGSAGGLGAALLVFLGAKLQSGITTVLDLIGFDELLAGADLVITGEGRTDWQSAFGKVLQGVGDRAKAAGVPAAALCGSLGKGYEEIYTHGICSLVTTVDGPMELAEAMERAEELYYKGALRLLRMVKTGMEIQRKQER